MAKPARSARSSQAGSARTRPRSQRPRAGSKARSKASGAQQGPVLLSGGNPQIAKADGDRPVQEYIRAMPGWKHRVGRHLDAAIQREIPNVSKAVRWNTPFYGIAGQGWFMAFHCCNRYVKVSFFAGTKLAPVPPVASKQPGVRYFHIHEHDVIDDALLNGWIRQASRLPGERCF